MVFFTRGVAFESESDLREKGAYKTPDMLLQVPMAVKGPSNEVGCVPEAVRVAQRTFGSVDVCRRLARPLNCAKFIGSCFGDSTGNRVPP